MTLMERVDRQLEGSSWDEAEEIGIEILGRCTALHVYARKEGGDYLMNLLRRICKAADKWAHEGNHSWILAFASMGHKKKMKEKSQPQTPTS